MSDTDRFRILGYEVMTLECSCGNEYGYFKCPPEVKKLIEEHPDWPFPYNLYAEHESKGLWWKYDESAKEAFIKEMEEGKVKWSNPNKQCKHCGRIFDPSYEFIEDEGLTNFCCDYDGNYRFPHYCPECIEKLYDYCNNAEKAFAADDIIKEG